MVGWREAGKADAEMRFSTAAFLTSILTLGSLISGCAVPKDSAPQEHAPTAASPSASPSEPAAPVAATTICVDSLLPGLAVTALQTIARIQPDLAVAHSGVAESLKAVGEPQWPPFATMTPEIGCPHGTPTLEIHADGSLLRDAPIRPPVQAASPYILKLFVLSDADADRLFPGRPYLRLPYERICDSRGGSCKTVSVALIVGQSNATNDAAIFSAVVDGLGLKQVFDALPSPATPRNGP